MSTKQSWIGAGVLAVLGVVFLLITIEADFAGTSATLWRIMSFTSFGGCAAVISQNRKAAKSQDWHRL